MLQCKTLMPDLTDDDYYKNGTGSSLKLVMRLQGGLNIMCKSYKTNLEWEKKKSGRECDRKNGRTQRRAVSGVQGSETDVVTLWTTNAWVKREGKWKWRWEEMEGVRMSCVWERKRQCEGCGCNDWVGGLAE